MPGAVAGVALTLGAASVTLLVLAAVASWIPARRAAQVNPTEALPASSVKLLS